jgi:hypothetical protein
MQLADPALHTSANRPQPIRLVLNHRTADQVCQLRVLLENGDQRLPGFRRRLPPDDLLRSLHRMILNPLNG